MWILNALGSLYYHYNSKIIFLLFYLYVYCMREKYYSKPLSILLTKLLAHIKQGLQKCCETAYARRGVNQMCILKNSKEILDHLKSPNFNLITNIKSFDLSTLYTTIPHQKLKSRLATIIRTSFNHINWNRRYKYMVLQWFILKIVWMGTVYPSDKNQWVRTQI